MEATCEVTRTIATYLLGEHQVYDLSSKDQCEGVADAMYNDPSYALYLFKHIPTVCCGGVENAVCTGEFVMTLCFFEAKA